MLFNQTNAAFALTKPLRRIGLCSQYLRYKVAIRIAIRHAKRQILTALWLAYYCMQAHRMQQKKSYNKNKSPCRWT